MKIFVLLFNLISLAICAQVNLPIDSTTKKITYYEVVKVNPELVKNVLFLNAEKWVDKNIQNPQLNPDSAKIIGTGSFVMTQMKGILEKQTGTVTFDFMLECKDGKYRYIFTEFVYRSIKLDKNGKKQSETKKKLEDTKAPGWNPQWRKYKATVNLRVNALIADLKEAMAKNPYVAPIEQKIQKKASDW